MGFLDDYYKKKSEDVKREESKPALKAGIVPTQVLRDGPPMKVASTPPVEEKPKVEPRKSTYTFSAVDPDKPGKPLPEGPSETAKAIQRYQAGLLTYLPGSPLKKRLKEQPEEFQTQWQEEIATGKAYGAGKWTGLLGGAVLFGRGVEKIGGKAWNKGASWLTSKLGGGTAAKLTGQAAKYAAIEGVAESAASGARSYGFGETFKEAAKRQAIEVPFAMAGGAVFGVGGEVLKGAKQAKKLKQLDEGYEAMKDSIASRKKAPDIDAPKFRKAADVDMDEGPDIAAEFQKGVDRITKKLDETLAGMTKADEVVTPKIETTPKVEVAPKTIDYRKIKTIDQLPSDIDGLESYLKQAKEAKAKGFKMDLQMFAEAERRLKMARETIGQAQSKYRGVTAKPKELANKIYARLFDVLDPLKRLDKKVGSQLELFASTSRRAGSTMQHVIDKANVNKLGEKIGESISDIYKDIPRGKGQSYFGTKDVDATELFEDYILHKHNIDRANLDKPVFGKAIKAEDSKEAVKFYEKNNPEFKKVQERLLKAYNDFFDNWAVDGNLVTKELRDKLRETYKNYTPTHRIMEDVLGKQKGRARGYANQKAPLKKAKGGETAIVRPLEGYIEMMDKTIKASKNNEVGLELLRAIEDNPSAFDDIAEVIGKGKKSADFDEQIIMDVADQYTKGLTAKGEDVITVMKEGAPVKIRIKDREVLRTLKGLTEGNPNLVTKIGRTITNPFKALITSKNPIFAVTNFFRDVPTAYINSAIAKNPAMFTGDMGRAAKKMLKDDKMWQEYLALGGENANLVVKNPKALHKKVIELTKGKGKLKTSFDAVGDAVQGMNNFTESLNRFAEYMRTIEKGGTSYANKLKALKNAAEVTTDFSRYGDWTKALDSWMPYLNPAMQGLDKFARNLKNAPVKTTAKSLAAITVPTIAFDILNNKVAKEEYAMEDNRTKDTYYLIPMPNGKFFKVPKTYQNGALFGSLFERVSRVARGEDVNVAFKGFGNTIANNFAPVGSLNPAETSVLAPFIYNLPANKDFAGRTIEPEYLKKRSEKLRYTERTSGSAKLLSNLITPLTKLSPAQIDYLIDAYTGVIGDFLIPATTPGKGAMDPLKRKFIADPLYNNQAIRDFYDAKEEVTRMAEDKNIKYDIPSKVVTAEEKRKGKYVKAANEISQLKKEILKLQKNKALTKEERQKRIDAKQAKVVRIAEQFAKAFQVSKKKK